MPSRILHLYTESTGTDFNKAANASGKSSSVSKPQGRDGRVSFDRVGALLANLSSDIAVRSDLVKFRRAFECRSSFDWLGESGKLPGRPNKDGIAYALRAAISVYDPGADEVLEEERDVVDAGGIDVDERLWLEKFATSSIDAVKDNLAMAQFAWAVTEAEQCDALNKVSDAALRKHLLSALRQYAKHYYSGTSIEPW